MTAPADTLLFSGTTETPGPDEDDFMVFKRNTKQVSQEEQRQERLEKLGVPNAIPKAAKRVVMF